MNFAVFAIIIHLKELWYVFPFDSLLLTFSKKKPPRNISTLANSKKITLMLVHFYIDIVYEFISHEKPHCNIDGSKEFPHLRGMPWQATASCLFPSLKVYYKISGGDSKKLSIDWKRETTFFNAVSKHLGDWPTQSKVCVPSDRRPCGFTVSKGSLLYF